MARASKPVASSTFPWPPHGWEYREVSLEYSGAWDTALDALGADGWRVVTIVHDEDVENAKDREVRVLLERPRMKAPVRVLLERPPKAPTMKRAVTSETGHEEEVDDADADEA